MAVLMQLQRSGQIRAASDYARTYGQRHARFMLNFSQMEKSGEKMHIIQSK